MPRRLICAEKGAGPLPLLTGPYRRRATFARVVSRETLVGGRCGGDTVDYDPAEYASFTLRLAGQMRREQVGG